MAKDQGSDLVAIPVFPRRLFSQGLLFVRGDSHIQHPEDLEGTRVDLWTYQTTLSVLTKGDLAHEYGAISRRLTRRRSFLRGRNF